MTRIFVPHDKDWDMKEPIWKVGFEEIYLDESEIDNGIVWFEFQSSDTKGSQWDNFCVGVDVKKRTVKGDGSRKFRGYILDHILYWYLKAREDAKVNEELIKD